jgi:hypothetical protein
LSAAPWPAETLTEYLETSARDSRNAAEAFLRFTKEIRDRVKRGEIKDDCESPKPLPIEAERVEDCVCETLFVQRIRRSRTSKGKEYFLILFEAVSPALFQFAERTNEKCQKGVVKCGSL